LDSFVFSKALARLDPFWFDDAEEGYGDARCMFGITLLAGVVELEQDVADSHSEEVKECNNSLLD
jgi:hypothetical protein